MPKSKPAPVVDCTDKDDKHVIFERANYDRHKLKHPELKDPEFCPKRVVEALADPKFTIKGNMPDTTCFYLEEFTEGGIVRYTKVVVVEYSAAQICYIMTAFYIDHIQELQYGHKPKYYR